MLKKLIQVVGIVCLPILIFNCSLMLLAQPYHPGGGTVVGSVGVTNATRLNSLVGDATLVGTSVPSNTWSFGVTTSGSTITARLAYPKTNADFVTPTLEGVVTVTNLTGSGPTSLTVRNLANPSSAQDAATKDYVDSLAGIFFANGSVPMTGDLPLGGNNLTSGGTINGTLFNGSGAGLTALDATQLTGTIADARQSSNVPLKNANTNAFTGQMNVKSNINAGNLVSTNGIMDKSLLSAPFIWTDPSGNYKAGTLGGNMTFDSGAMNAVTYTIPSSGVSAGSYTTANITVGADGRVTSAANGTASGSITNNPLLNVRDYGAKGDGVTDDTAAFLAAQSAAGTTNGVYVPAGNYGITGPIILTNNLLVGAGYNLSKLTLLNATNQAHLMYATNVGGGQIIRDICFDGNTNLSYKTGTSSSVLWGITHNAINDGEISKCKFINFYAPLRVVGTNDINGRRANTAYLFNIMSNNYYGIWLSTSNWAEYVRVEGNSFRYNNIGILNDAAANVQVVGNMITDSASLGIFEDGSGAADGGTGTGRGHSEYWANIVNHNGSGIKFLLCSKANFHGNAVLGVATAITLATCTNCIIAENHLELSTSGSGGIQSVAGQTNYVFKNYWVSTPVRVYDPTNCVFDGNINFNGVPLPVWESYANNLLFPATNAVPFTLAFQGSGMFSDGTNLVVVLRNAAGVSTTNKVTMTSWP